MVIKIFFFIILLLTLFVSLWLAQESYIRRTVPPLYYYIIVYSVVPIFLQPRVGWDGSVGALVIPSPGGVVDKFSWRGRRIL